MTVEELKAIELMEDFNRVKDALNLSDRQKEIFYLRFSRLMCNADIAAELNVCRDTIEKDIAVIRKKLYAVQKDKLDAIAKLEEIRRMKELEEQESKG